MHRFHHECSERDVIELCNLIGTHCTEHTNDAMYVRVAQPLPGFFKRRLATVVSIVYDGCGLILITAHVYIM